MDASDTLSDVSAPQSRIWSFDSPRTPIPSGRPWPHFMVYLTEAPVAPSKKKKKAQADDGNASNTDCPADGIKKQDRQREGDGQGAKTGIEKEEGGADTYSQASHPYDSYSEAYHASVGSAACNISDVNSPSMQGDHASYAAKSRGQSSNFSSHQAFLENKYTVGAADGSHNEGGDDRDTTVEQLVFFAPTDTPMEKKYLIIGAFESFRRLSKEIKDSISLVQPPAEKMKILGKKAAGEGEGEEEATGEKGSSPIADSRLFLSPQQSVPKAQSRLDGMNVSSLLFSPKTPMSTRVAAASSGVKTGRSPAIRIPQPPLSFLHNAHPSASSYGSGSPSKHSGDENSLYSSSPSGLSSDQMFRVRKDIFAEHEGSPDQRKKSTRETSSSGRLRDVVVGQEVVPMVTEFEEVEFEFENTSYILRRVDRFYFVVGWHQTILKQHMDVIVMAYRYLTGPLHRVSAAVSPGEAVHTFHELYSYLCEELMQPFPSIPYQPSLNAQSSLMFASEHFIQQLESLPGVVTGGIFVDDLLLHSHLTYGVEKLISSRLQFIRSNAYPELSRSAESYAIRITSENPMSAHRVMCRVQFGGREKRDNFPIFISNVEQGVLIDENRSVPASETKLDEQRLLSGDAALRCHFPSSPDGDWFGVYYEQMDRVAVVAVILFENLYADGNMILLRRLLSSQLPKLCDMVAHSVPVIRDVRSVTPAFSWEFSGTMLHLPHQAGGPVAPFVVLSPSGNNGILSPSSSTSSGFFSKTSSVISLSPASSLSIGLQNAFIPFPMDMQNMSLVVFEPVLGLAKGCCDLERDAMVQKSREYLEYDESISSVILRSEQGTLFVRKSKDYEVFVRNKSQPRIPGEVEYNARSFLFQETKQVFL
eukprot:ANDGO_05154.mRNA.1 hypothetical protein